MVGRLQPAQNGQALDMGAPLGADARAYGFAPGLGVYVGNQASAQNSDSIF
jgi:hypothetical protein